MPLPRDPEIVAIMIDSRRRGLTVKEIVQDLNASGCRNTYGRPWTEGAVMSAFRCLGVKSPKAARPPLSPAELDWIRVLTAEGVPSSWIAEDLKANRNHIGRVAHRFPGAEEKSREWKTAWAQIKGNPQLRELHQEFAPRKRVTA